MKAPRFSAWVRPGQTVLEAYHAAQQRAAASTRANGLLILLLPLLLVAGLTQCRPSRKIAAVRHREEHAAPAASRYEAHWADLDHD